MSEHLPAPTQEDITAHLAALQEAWSWFVARGILLRQNVSTGEWMVETWLVLTIGTNTPASLQESLKRHQVVIEEQENCLKAFFPDGTRKMPQLDLPGTYLLTLPDGWAVQEMRLPVHRRDLPYSSVLVPSAQDEPVPAIWTVGSPGECFP